VCDLFYSTITDETRERWEIMEFYNEIVEYIALCHAVRHSNPFQYLLDLFSR
jgi:hypothetical protein